MQTKRRLQGSRPINRSPFGAPEALLALSGVSQNLQNPNRNRKGLGVFGVKGRVQGVGFRVLSSGFKGSRV